MTSTVYRFGRFELRPASRQLLVEGEEAAIGKRGFDILVALVERRERMVSKSELFDLVWPGLVVEENNLQVQVSALRKILGPQAITTVPGQGYRFALTPESEGEADPLTVQGANAEGSVPPQTPPSPSGPRLTNLPSQSDELIGRDADVVSLMQLLAEHRLVTVLGAGGIGKTRLAQAVARRLTGAFANGVWWVDLAALTSADKIAPAIANAAGLQLGDGNAVAMLASALFSRESLLVLDNCEHLVADVALITHELLAAAPGVRVLGTSQEALRVSGEYLYRLAALAIPPVGAPLPEARTYSALELLERRAQAANRHFSLSDDTVAGAIELCRQLDGIALAIEMAAARLPILGIEGMHERLGERLRLLRATTRDASARHQTLRATLDWSHSLLTADEQAVLRRLSVLVGSFRLDIAQAVTINGLDEWVALDALAALVDKSLVQLEGVEPPRYRLLETTRIYASEQLAAAGEVESTLLRHGSALARLAGNVERDHWLMSDLSWLARYAPDYDDMQAAFERACARGDAEVAAATSEALRWMDDLRNDLSTLRARAEAAHALLPRASPLAQARLWNRIAGHNVVAFTDVPRLAAARERVAAWRPLGNPPQLGLALAFLSGACARAGEFEDAERALGEAYALVDPQWPTRLRGLVAYNRTWVSIFRADAAGYRDAARANLALAEESGAERAAGMARLHLADAALMAGDADEAIALGRDAVKVLRALDQPTNLGLALGNLSSALLLTGDVAAARAAMVEAFPLMQRNEMGAYLFDNLALLAAHQGRPAIAAQVLGISDRRYAIGSDVRQANEARIMRQAVDAIEAALGTAESARLRTAGAELSAGEAYSLAGQVLAEPPAG